MSQENVQNTDTPQESQNTEYASLEEAVFGEGFVDSTGESAFNNGNEGNTETAPQEGQPVQDNAIEDTQQPAEVANDDRRYQYWQSQADKMANENKALKNQIAQVGQQQTRPVQEQPQDNAENFPPPPAKPEKPRHYSREEAYADPQSDSARYLDDVEVWRDDMTEYNTLRTQYQEAVVEERMQAQDNARIAEAQKQQAFQAKKTQERSIKEHVMANYGMNEAETQDFMQTMSNPKSLNIDNLVQLYRLQKGGAPVQQVTSNPEPSPEFQQYQNAQQVPSPMGVMPSGQTNEDSRSFEDKIMDTMIGNFNSKNPWK
tara:strand:- start:11787 stop:12734 length:948 start_codon:yes stop_codon:yes gene_type:complete